MKRQIYCALIILLLCAMGAGCAALGDATNSEQAGKSWYLIVNNAVTGHMTAGPVTTPVDVWLVMMLKTETLTPGAQGNYLGICYYEWTNDMSAMMQDGKSYFTGNYVMKSFSMDCKFPINQLGGNVDYTQYSGTATVQFYSYRTGSVQARQAAQVAVNTNDAMLRLQEFKITIHPKAAAGDMGMDAMVEFTGAGTQTLTLAPILGKLYSSDEISEQDYLDAVESLDQQIARTRAQAEKEASSDPAQAQIDSIQSQIDDLISKADMLENAIEQGYTDPTTPQGKATALEAADARTEAEILQQQLDGLPK